MTLTAEQRKVIVTVNGDPDGGGARDHIFEMVAGGDEGLSIRPYLRTGYLIAGRGNLVNTIIQEFTDSGESPRKGFYFDAGNGEYIHEIDFQGWEGAQYEGQALQWGDTGDDSNITATDATGADPITQIQILLYVIRNVQIDSRNPATLEFGQHSDGGVLDPLDVVFEEPGAVHQGSTPSTFDGSLTCIEAASLEEAWDAIANDTR